MNHNHTQHTAPDSFGASYFKEALMNAGTGIAVEAVKQLARELTAPADPDYKDDWEKGYDAGREAAGRELVGLLQRMGFSE